MNDRTTATFDEKTQRGVGLGVPFDEETEDRRSMGGRTGTRRIEKQSGKAAELQVAWLDRFLAVVGRRPCSVRPVSRAVRPF